MSNVWDKVRAYYDSGNFTRSELRNAKILLNSLSVITRISGQDDSASVVMKTLRNIFEGNLTQLERLIIDAIANSLHSDYMFEGVTDATKNIRYESVRQAAMCCLEYVTSAG